MLMLILCEGVGGLWFSMAVKMLFGVDGEIVDDADVDYYVDVELAEDVDDDGRGDDDDDDGDDDGDAADDDGDDNGGGGGGEDGDDDDDDNDGGVGAEFDRAVDVHGDVEGDAHVNVNRNGNGNDKL
jgi:hypothetical protein